VRAFFPSCINPVSPFSAVASIRVSSQRSPLSPLPRAAAGGDQENRVQELRVPDSWLTPAGAAQVWSHYFTSLSSFPPLITM
jgi:hypothetical protein